uniref:Putative salivary kunitz domain protein n=1 Tax=Ixodes ricinus TaxID=34613 RepID=A0A0K8R5L9_IXORI
MKLLLIAVVICIHTPGFLTTAKKAKCERLYNGGRGGPGGANVKQGWSFNPQTKRCQNVMYRSLCPPPRNCFPTEFECEENCDPRVLELLNLIP